MRKIKSKKFEIFVFHERFKSIDSRIFYFDSFLKIKKAFSLLIFDGFKIEIKCFDKLSKKEIISLLSMIKDFNFNKNDDIENIKKDYERYLNNGS